MIPGIESEWNGLRCFNFDDYTMSARKQTTLKYFPSLTIRNMFYSSSSFTGGRPPEAFVDYLETHINPKQQKRNLVSESMNKHHISHVLRTFFSV